MTEPIQTQDQNCTHLLVQLQCGTMLEITQLERGMNFTLSATPKPGIPVHDFTDTKGDRLNIRLTEESLIGLYQTLQMIVEPKRSRRPKQQKSWFQKVMEA